jgi:peptide/nickel transport system permease protein
MGVARHILVQVVSILPFMFFVITIGFVIVHLAPGDPLTYLLGSYNVTPAVIEAARHRLGLDRPLIDQYFIYLAEVMKGDLGYSIMEQRPVYDIIMERYPATLLLMISSIAFGTVIGILSGVYAAKGELTMKDHVITTISVAGFSVPPFWLGMMLILMFSFYFKILPTSGMIDPRAGGGWLETGFDVLKHLILPALTLSLFFYAIIARLTRENVLEELDKNYVVTARAKGLKEDNVLFRHALRNALIPIVTVIGLNIGIMVGGAVLVETVFSWPGVGLLIYDSILNRDYPLVIGSFIFLSISVPLANIATDLVYTAVNPKVRYEAKQQ